MNILHHQDGQEIIAEVVADTIIIQKEQDAIRLLEALYESGATRLILHQENISPAFFELRTGLAGAVLQKFVQYQVPIAIVGDFSDITSESLKAFIYESNRGRHVFFLRNVEEAVQKLKSSPEESG